MDTINDRVIDDVRAVLANDPRLPAADEIAVDAFGATVTLRGTVGSFAQKRAAVSDARRAGGVADVFDELNVRLLDDDRRNDAEIRGAALQRLIWDSLIPGDARTSASTTAGSPSRATSSSSSRATSPST